MWGNASHGLKQYRIQQQALKVKKKLNDASLITQARWTVGGFVAQCTLGKAADVATSSQVREELGRHVTHYTRSMDSSNAGHAQVQGKGQAQQTIWCVRLPR